MVVGSGNSPAGWYPDPTDPRKERFWDGSHWTPAVRQASGASHTASEVSPTTPPAPPVVDAQLPAPPIVKGPVPPSVDRSSGMLPKLRAVALGVGLVLAVACVGFVVSGGLRSDPSADSASVPSSATEPTTATTSPPRTTTTAVASTTSPPTSTTSTIPPETTQAPTSTSFVGRSEFLAIPREWVSATCQGANGIEGDLVTPVITLRGIWSMDAPIQAGDVGVRRCSQVV